VKKVPNSESLRAFDVFTCMLKLNLPVVFGIMVQLIPLNPPTVTSAISCVLFVVAVVSWYVTFAVVRLVSQSSRSVPSSSRFVHCDGVAYVVVYAYLEYSLYSPAVAFYVYLCLV